MLVSVTGAVHTDRQMRFPPGAFLFIASPLVAGGEEQPWLGGLLPQPMITQGIAGEVDDFPFMLIEPFQPLFERDFVSLPVAVGNVDLQPICATLSEHFAFAKFEQRSSGLIRLRIDELRHGISAAAMIQLPRKIELGLREQPLRRRKRKAMICLRALSSLAVYVCNPKNTRSASQSRRMTSWTTLLIRESVFCSALKAETTIDKSAV
jgi:hypothetical protein